MTLTPRELPRSLYLREAGQVLILMAALTVVGVLFYFAFVLSVLLTMTGEGIVALVITSMLVAGALVAVTAGWMRSCRRLRVSRGDDRMKGSRGLLFLCLLAIPIVTIGGALQVAIAFYCPNVCGEVSLELVPASLLLGLGSSVVVSLMGIRRLMGTSGNANVNEDDVHG